MKKVDIIVPVYNRIQYLSEALESIYSQSYKNFQIIVVDDGSTDDVENMVKKYKGSIKYIYQKNQGVAAARNAGLKEADGEYLAFLDSDDVWMDNYLKEQVKFLEDNPSIDVVCRPLYIFEDATKEYIKIIGSQIPVDSSIQKRILEGGIPPSGVLAKRKCFNNIFFDRSLKGDEDIELWFRLSQNNTIQYINFPLGRYRRHGNNWTSSPERVLFGHLKVCKKIYQFNLSEELKNLLLDRISRTRYQLASFYFKEKKMGKAILNYALSKLRLF